MTPKIHAPANVSPYAARKARKQIAQECLIKQVNAMIAGLSPRGLPALACDAQTRRQTPCQAFCTAGETRCRLHGGRSTGPKTDDGKARCAAGRWNKGGNNDAE